MAQPEGSLQDKESSAFIKDVVDNQPNKRVQVMNDATNPIPVDIGSANVTILGDSITSGTVDGTPGGTERTFVNNKKQQVLSAHDLVAAYTWLDFGNKNERVSSILYTSATFAGVNITRTFAYTLVGTNYRLDTETWTSSVGG